MSLRWRTKFTSERLDGKAVQAMGRSSVVAVGAITVALLAVGPRAARAQGLSASDVERVSAEVTETMETYYALFSARDTEALPDRVFAIPWMTLGANGIAASTSRDEGAAIVSGFNTRYDGGGVMSVGSVSYVLGTTDDGWRIIAYTGHERGKVVTC